MKNSRMEVGFAKVDVVPGKQYDLSGYVVRSNPSVGVHDPVSVRVLYAVSRVSPATSNVTSDVTSDVHWGEAAIVSVDVLGFEPAHSYLIRSKVAETLGMPVQAVMLAATHTHGAPATMHLGGCGNVDRDWIVQLEDAIVRCSTMAKNNVKPATVGFGAVRVPGISRNRRHVDGPLDETLTCMKVAGANGKLEVVVGNFACHPVVLGAENRLVSADYPSGFYQCFEEENVGAVFLTGAAADINPLAHADHASAEKMGRRLGEAAWDVVTKLETAVLPIHAVERKFSVEWERPHPDTLKAQIEQYQQALDNHTDPGADPVGRRIYETWRDWARAYLEDNGLVSGNKMDVSLQVNNFGDVSIVGLPAEVFCASGLALKAELGPLTIVSGYTNGDIGYVPTADQYDIGGYEVDEAHKYMGYPGRVRKGTSERMVRLVVDSFKAMK